MHNWRGGAEVGKLYMIQSEEDLSRVGNCPMHGRVKVGDILIAEQHAGDCFFEYRLVEVWGNAIRLTGIRVPAYVFGELLTWQPTDEQAAWLFENESVRTEEVQKELDAFEKTKVAKEQEALLKAVPGNVVKLRGHSGRNGHQINFATVVENTLCEKQGGLRVAYIDSEGERQELSVSKDKLKALHLVY